MTVPEELSVKKPGVAAAPVAEPIDLEIPPIEIPDPLPFAVADAAGRGGIYARISQLDTPDTASLKTQAQACLNRNLADRFTQNPEHIWIERQSGFKTDDVRPKLNEAKQAALRGEIDRLTIYATDRLARSDDLKFLVRWFERRGCAVVFVTFDRVQGHIGDFMLDTMAFATTHQVVMLRDATDRGRSDLRNLGLLLGCGPCRYGYRWEGRNRVRDPETAEVVELIFELVGNRGYSTVRVAHYLNDHNIPSPYMARPNRRNKAKVTKWSPTRVGYIIRERAYLGLSLEGFTEPVIGQDGERVRVMVGDKLRTVRKPVEPANHREAANSTTERLISDELFRKANAVLTDKKWKTARKRNEADLWLLRGLVYCGGCGYRMSPHKVATRGSKPRHYYHCATRATRFRHDRAECDARLVRREHLDDMAWSKMESLLRDPKQIAREIRRSIRDGNAPSIEVELKDLAKDLAAANRDLKKYETAFMNATNARLRKLAEDAFAAAEGRVKEIEARRETLNVQLRPFRELEATQARILDMARDFAAQLDDPSFVTPAWKRQVLEGLGVAVHFHNGVFRMTWKPPVAVDPGVVLPISIP
jgi:site-specific DNA recombinase